MNWIEEKIVGEYMRMGFPAAMAYKMTLAVMKETIRQNVSVQHKDLPCFIYVDGKAILISTDLDLKE